MRNYFALIFLFAVLIHVQAQETKSSLTSKSLKTLNSKSLPSHFYGKTHQSLMEKVGFDVSKKSNGSPIKIKISKGAENPEAFVLKISEKGAFIESGSERGVYYALLKLKEWQANPTRKNVELKDFPDVAFRGVVEGFYGKPWGYNDRLRMLAFLGENKMNTYIYGPKDDPYHSSPHWRKDYPEIEARQIQDYVKKANESYVDFYWAIHPGKDIKWNKEDRDNLLHKFEKMYDLGVRGFSVFFDDITGEGTNAKKQAELLNFLQTEFVEKKPDVLPLIMCPTEYNKGWSNIEGGYLPTLGNELNPKIHIMWTGDGVIGDVTKETLVWINDKIKRKAFFWWNFPVTDYVRDHLMLGPAYTLDNKAQNLLAGVVSNPMEHAEASRIGIASLGDYAWDIVKYDSIQSWKRNIIKEFPTCHKAYEIFAKNHADPGPNGHRYRKLESWDFPIASSDFLEDLKKGQVQEVQKVKVQNYYNDLYLAATTLQQCKDNPAFILEIYPWILQAKNVAKKGLETLKMYDAFYANNKLEFLEAYKNAEAWELRRFYLDQDENQNPYQPGVESASRIVKPLIDSTFTVLVQKYNKKENENLNVNAYYNPHVFTSNNAQLKNLNITFNNNVLKVSPLLEVVILKPNDYFMYDFNPEKNLKQIVLNFGEGKNSFQDWGVMEVSVDGKEWTALEGKETKHGWIANPNKKVKMLRFKNHDNKNREVYLRRLDVNL